jgi:hypothetical protein
MQTRDQGESFGVEPPWTSAIAVSSPACFFDLGFVGKVDKIRLIVSSHTSLRTDSIRQVDHAGTRGTSVRRCGATVRNGSKVVAPGTGRSLVLGATLGVNRVTRRSRDTSGINRLRQKP